MQRGRVGSSRRSCRRASTGRHAWPKRGNIQSPDPGGPWQTRPLLPDSVWHALVGGQGFFVYGGRHQRWRGEARGDVERSCYCIHAPIHKALPQAKAVFHTHMPFASALTRLEDPHIKEIGQTEVGMMEMIAYDDNYTGPAFDPAEGERLAKVLVNKTVLFMANHGVTTVGQSVADAYNRLYYIERAAQVQIYAMWTGQRLKQLPETVIEKAKNEIGGARFYNGPTPAERHFCALKRILDREEADYAS